MAALSVGQLVTSRTVGRLYHEQLRAECSVAGCDRLSHHHDLAPGEFCEFCEPNGRVMLKGLKRRGRVEFTATSAEVIAAVVLSVELGPSYVERRRKRFAKQRETQREIGARNAAAVAACRAEGLTQREAAARLGISERTVRNHWHGNGTSGSLPGRFQTRS